MWDNATPMASVASNNTAAPIAIAADWVASCRQPRNSRVARQSGSIAFAASGTAARSSGATGRAIATIAARRAGAVASELSWPARAGESRRFRRVAESPVDVLHFQIGESAVEESCVLTVRGKLLGRCTVVDFWLQDALFERGVLSVNAPGNFGGMVGVIERPCRLVTSRSHAFRRDK